jgi:sugar O-acyltransferase (sialic acid O-acetyltransferase NeuD family)
MKTTHYPLPTPNSHITIIGAGGHALEVIDLLLRKGFNNLAVYGEEIQSKAISDAFPTYTSLEEIKQKLQTEPHFCLGIGNIAFRYRLFTLFKEAGGIYFPLVGEHTIISPSADLSEIDVMDKCYIGPQTSIGQGSMINVGAQVHHEVKIGSFSVINPAAVLLGACQIGDFCSIGANATVLPGIKIGNKVTIGAGAVINKDIPDHVTVVGVPGRIIDR